MSTTNLLIAIKNIVENSNSHLMQSHSRSSNRANSAGESLENYIKDVFCGTLNVTDEKERIRIFETHFSYLGNQNNPPDMMIRGGDAIEVKKMEGSGSSIALNSSYPKDKLYADSTMLTEGCKSAESWVEKDLLYAVGVAPNGILKSLWFVYGDCYASNKFTYERIKNAISEGIQDLPYIEFAETKELGRINKVDPLGITYLRIRGMWHIENPSKVFEYIVKKNKSPTDFSFYALLLKDKYDNFPEQDKLNLESLHSKFINFSITDEEIKSPNNPAKLLDAKLISFWR